MGAGERILERIEALGLAIEVIDGKLDNVIALLALPSKSPSASPGKVGGSSAPVKLVYPNEFAKFWAACHPKMRVAKRAALREWLSSRRRGNLPESLLDAVKLYCRSRPVRDGYITTAERWLKNDRQHDDPATKQASGSGQSPPDASSLDLPDF